MYECRCDCGEVCVVPATRLISGAKKSCGCLRREARPKPGINITHGYAKTRIYRVWSGVVFRCTNPRSITWRSYGGRGISVCDRWRRFENFLADMGDPGPGYAIHRIDNDGNYEPGNCQWLLKKTHTELHAAERRVEREPKVLIPRQPAPRLITRFETDWHDGVVKPIIIPDAKLSANPKLPPTTRTPTPRRHLKNAVISS